MRNALYEEVPPKEKEDTEITHFLRAKRLTAFLKFEVLNIQRQVGGAEYFVFTELWKKGGQYIINCKFTGSYTQVEENHAFVYNTDYTGPDGKCYNSIIDNQKNTHLFGIEKNDLSTKAKVRQICNNLFSGETRFTHCFKVT